MLLLLILETVCFDFTFLHRISRLIFWEICSHFPIFTYQTYLRYILYTILAYTYNFYSLALLTLSWKLDNFCYNNLNSFLHFPIIVTFFPALLSSVQIYRFVCNFKIPKKNICDCTVSYFFFHCYKGSTTFGSLNEEADATLHVVFEDRNSEEEKFAQYIFHSYKW